MKISALVAAYNTERFVGEAVESMLTQTAPPFEIIAVDDGSADGTVAVLRSFGARVQVIERPHLGAPAAFNAAVEAASGDVLAFNDADDLWAPAKLELLGDRLEADPALEAVFGAVQKFASPEWTEGSDAASLPQAGIHKIGMLIRREAFLRVGLFDTSFMLCEFGDWYARALQATLRSQLHPDVVGYRRLHDSNSGRIHRDHARSEHLLALKRSLDARRALRPARPG